MTTIARLFNKTFVKTKSGVDNGWYIKQFASRALSQDPYFPFSADINMDAGLFKPDFTLIDLLVADSDKVLNAPFVDAAEYTETKFEDLPAALRRHVEGLPLVSGERVASIRVLCLGEDWNGLPRRMVYMARETNFACVYFAVPGLRADPKSPGMTHAALLNAFSLPAPSALTAANALTGVSSGDPYSDFEDIGLPVINTFLEIVSTLSWVDPEAGPFVSAGVTFLEAVIGGIVKYFEPGKPSLLDKIKDVADGIVMRIEFFEEQDEIRKSINALTEFSDWIKKITAPMGVLDTQISAIEAYSDALTEHNGILATLNGQLGPNVPRSLFKLKSDLEHDSLLQGAEPYQTKREWALASAKLRLLLLTTAQYLFAIKLKIVLRAKLYDGGRDQNGMKIEKRSSDPLNTFGELIGEIENFKESIPKHISAVRTRRAKMVVLEVTDRCKVAYSRDQKWIGNQDMPARRGQWSMNDRDGLYTGYHYDQMVRSEEDAPSKNDFETTYDTICIGTHCTYGPPYVRLYPWQRTEIRDGAVYDGQNPQDWVLSDSVWGTIASYNHNTEKAELLKSRYLSKVLKDLDEWAKLPGVLDQSVKELCDRWKPQLPAKLPVGVMLDIKEWGNTAVDDEIWSDKSVSVRYRFSVRSKIGNESEKSDDVYSTRWLGVSGKCRPLIVGLPTNGSYLEYISDLCLYRQFRKMTGHDDYQYGTERLVAIIPRNEGEMGFVGQWVDDRSAKFDKAEINK